MADQKVQIRRVAVDRTLNGQFNMEVIAQVNGGMRRTLVHIDDRSHFDKVIHAAVKNPTFWNTAGGAATIVQTFTAT